MSRVRRQLPYHQGHQHGAPEKDVVNGNLVLPHTTAPPRGLGDVYDKWPFASVREWELQDVNNRPYLSHIKRVAQVFPCLRYLADWMEVSTSPLKWELIKDQEQIIRKERAARTNVAVVDFVRDHGVTVSTIKDCSTLSQSLSELTYLEPETARLYIVEDLSRDGIETLGAALDIDPRFFRGHISDYLWYNTRDIWVELPDLKLVSADRNFINLRYVQARYFRTRDSFEKATKETALFNVLRRIDDDKNRKAGLDVEDAVFGLQRSKIAFWQRAASSGRSGAIGVLLVDPSVTEGHPLWGGHQGFHRTPSISEQGPLEGPPRNSTFDALLYWTHHTSHQEIKAILADPYTMCSPILKMICGEWLALCQYINTRLVQIEWELENPNFRNDPDGLNSALTKLHVWRRAVPLYHASVVEAIDILFSGKAQVKKPGEYMVQLHRDFEDIRGRLGDLEHRIEDIMNVAIAIASIEETRREYRQNQYLGRLTWLAVVFAPLSFVSSFFSMTADVAMLKSTYYIYFCVSLPVSLLAFLLVNIDIVKRWVLNSGKRDK